MTENNPSTAYHPQTDGQTERINQDLEQYLRIYINHHQDDWVEWLSLAEFAYNNRKHASTGLSPFFVNKGHHPRVHAAQRPRPLRGLNNESVTEFAETMTKIHEEVKAHLEHVNLTTKRNVDKHWRLPTNYNLGDLVWLSSANIPSDRPSRKLDYKFLGPYVVVEKVGSSAYKIKTPGRSTRHATFNETLLKKHNKG